MLVLFPFFPLTRVAKENARDFLRLENEKQLEYLLGRHADSFEEHDLKIIY